jgi:uncharacterized FlaG/YvyC family protein
MDLNEEFLQDTMKQLESSFDEVSKLKFTLLDTAMDQVAYVFEVDEEGNSILKDISKDEIKEIYNAIQTDMIPLFEEFQYEEGLNKIRVWEKLLEEVLA